MPSLMNDSLMTASSELTIGGLSLETKSEVSFTIPLDIGLGSYFTIGYELSSILNSLT